MGAENRDYYDAFSNGYDDGRNVGYHKLIDDQAAALVKRVGTDKDVLEIGCGTGLVLERVVRFARSAQGIDISPGMLKKAQERGLTVQEGDCTDLPFEDESFDTVYSFKVLAHVPDVDRALAEMLRVLRPGGHMVIDVYNRHSIRYLTKRLFGPRRTSNSFDEGAISTRFWTPEEAETHIPVGAKLIGTAGIRVATPHSAIFRVPVLGDVVRQVEWSLMDSPLARFAGFLVMFLEKQQ